MHLELIYDLAEDADRIANIQSATLADNGFGIEPDPALFGSDEWWDAVERGVLPVTSIEGSISRVRWESMNDWPVFDLAASNGETSTWTREGDLTRYVQGLAVKVDYVMVTSRQRTDRPRPHEPLMIRALVEPSRLRACDVAPGPGDVGFRDLTTLYRPVGDAELRLIEASHHRAFPPRLERQPYFYPVLEESYATKIARDWNTKDERSGFVGYVTAFHVRSDHLNRYDIQQVGGRDHREYWIPADELDDFNRNLAGRIDVLAEFGDAPLTNAPG